VSWILKFLGAGSIGNILIAAAVVAAVAASTGFATAWTVNGWRLGTKIERLAGEASALRAANARCSVNVAEVRDAVAGIVKAGEERAEQARKGIEKAQAAAVVHINRAAGIIKRPPVAPEKQCDTVREEQAAYVRERRAETD